MGNVPNSNNLMDIFKSSVDTSTGVIKTIVKNQVTYAAAIIAVPLYFKAVGKLYKGYASFAIHNVVNSAVIITAGKLIQKTLPIISDNISTLNEIVGKLESPRFYKKSIKKIEYIYEILGTIIYGLSSNKNKMKRFSLSNKTLGRRLTRMIFNMVLYELVIKYWKKAFTPLFDEIIPSLEGYNKRKHRRVMAAFGRMQELLASIVDFLSSETIQKTSALKNIRTFARLITLCSQIVVLGGTFAILGTLAVPIMFGTIAFRVLVWGFLGIFMTKDREFDQSKSKSLRKSVRSLTWLMKGLAALISIIITKKIIENLIQITSLIGDGKSILIGIAAMTGVFISLIWMIKIISLFNLKKADKARTLINILKSFIMAWAAAKIAETIAPIGKQAKDIFIGAAVISGITLIFIGLFKILSLIKIKNNIHTVIKVISSFITAWAAAKIAETIAPIANIAKEVLVGTLVVCSVVMMIITTFWAASKMLKMGKLIKAAIGLTVISVAVLWSFTTLAFAAIFAPFAIITMTALSVVCLISALVGALSKSIIKGSIAMIFLGIALSKIAAPLLIIGITGAILGAVLGSPKMILVTMTAISGFILAFAGIAALVGLLVQTGVFEIGIFGMILLSVAMTTISIPLLLFAIAAEKISKLQIQDNKYIISDIIEIFINGIKKFFTKDGLLYLNPIVLSYITMSIFQLMIIACNIGIIGNILRHISSLSMPVEWDKNGNPTKYVTMQKKDFENAAITAATILQFFTALFKDEKTTLPNGVVVGGAMNGLKNIKRSTIRKVRRIRKIAKQIGEIAEILQHIASLNIPIEWDNSGRPNKFVKMTAADFGNASMNAASILQFFIALFDDNKTKLKLFGKTITVTGIDMSALNRVKRKSKRKIKRLSKIVGYIGSMSSILQHIAYLSVPDPDKGYDESGRPLGYKLMDKNDFANATNNASAVFSFFADLFADKPITRNILGLKIKLGATNNLKDIDRITGSMKRKIKKLGKIVSVIGSMSNTIQNIASLSIPIGFDNNGKPIGYRHMMKDDFTAASENIGKIMETLLKSISDEKLIIILDQMSKKSLENFEKVMTPMTSLTGVVEVIQMMAGGEYVKSWKTDEDGNRIPAEYESFRLLLEGSGADKIKNDITKLMTIVVGGLSDFSVKHKNTIKNASKSLDDITKIMTTIKDPIESIVLLYKEQLIDLDIDAFESKYSKLTSKISGMISSISESSKDANTGKLSQIKQNITETTKLMKQIDKTDLNKLKHASSLINGIAKISKDIRGNFEGLSKTINKDLIKALEELKKVLDDINNGIGKDRIQMKPENFKTVAQTEKNGKMSKQLANRTKEPTQADLINNTGRFNADQVAGLGIRELLLMLIDMNGGGGQPAIRTKTSR